MALLAYNLTTSPLALAAGSVTLPASASAGRRGPAMNVTTELRPNATVDPVYGITGGLTGANFTSIQAQVTAGDAEFEWTGDAEYATGALVAQAPAQGTGSAAVALLTQSGQPSANDTIDVGADTYEFDGTGTNINVTIAGSAEATLDNLLAAAVASGTEDLLWDKLDATNLRLRSATGPQGSVVGADPSIALDASGATNWVVDVGDVNMNTLAGRAPTVPEFAATTLTVTAGMITTGAVRVAFPFTPVVVLFSAWTSAGVQRLTQNDTAVISGDDVVVTLAGGAAPDVQATDVLRVVAYS